MRMILKLQKRLASTVLNCSPKRVIFDPARLEDIKEAITKTDIRMLVGEGVITERPEKGVSRVRANKRKRQKSKGLRKGEGSRKGKATARRPKKQAWMDRIRAQRNFLKYLRSNNLLKPGAFKELYVKSKGGFFRSIKHIKLHIHEHDLMLINASDKKQMPIKPKGKFQVQEGQESSSKSKSKESFKKV
jgi:large subunit ribosomal protein L19e